MVKAKHLESALTGEGAFRFGARWTSMGRRAVYAASTTSLAILEVLAHLEDARPLAAYSLIRLEFPEGLVVAVPRKVLPPNWREFPAPPTLQAIGDAWLVAGTSPCLRVPSVLVPDLEGAEANFILNPVHPDFRRIKVGAPIPVEFDPRL